MIAVIGVSLYSMDRSVRYFTFSRKVLSFVGLWYTQTYRERLLRYCVIGFMSFYFVFSQLCQLLTSQYDPWSAVRLLRIAISSVTSLTLYFYSILHFETIKQMYTYILYDLQILKDDTELKIIQKYAHYVNLVTFAGAVFLYTYAIVYITAPLLRIILSTNEIRSDIDSYPIISCFDYFSSRETYYNPVIMYQIITFFTLSTATLACYWKLLTFLLHVCARLSIIKYNIYSPFIHNNNNDHVVVTPIDLSPWIINIVKSLVRTTEFMTLINTSYEQIYLVQTFLALFLLIVNFFCIPVLLEHKAAMNDIMELVVHIFGIFFVVYMNCYIGQKVIDNSIDVYKEMCSVPFHEMSLKTQKLLLMALSMCANPYTLSIGKFYVLSHEFFSNLLQTSLSFAMVVHSLQTI